ncbi:MAG TPA: class I SAM-dependent methyltransferase [Thermoanaerobaculia bacterium]|jgi:SAM-dependent methyltransferase|nr:class I SAM-dependent methyltransferase [Thermoanaerobaculia bacterium]
MDIQTLREEKQKVIQRHGDWTDHNIHIAENIYTIGENVLSTRLRRIVQIVADVCNEPFANLRVLDLACLEGLYAIEFARQGARAVGIEGRESNIEKARFIQKALGLDPLLTLCQDDVRNLCREKYGEFDVVLCLGILYHLDTPDVFRFVENIADVTTRLAVIDTYVSIASKDIRTHEGKSYWGREIFEHFPSDSTEQRLSRAWASLDNPKSFWLTERSLYNLLSACGFTTVYQCQVPSDVYKPADRITLLAIKGKPQTLVSTPKVNEIPVADWPERWKPRVSPEQDPRVLISKRLSHMVPSALKRPVKAVLRATGLMAKNPQRWRAEPRPPRDTTQS